MDSNKWISFTYSGEKLKMHPFEIVTANTCSPWVTLYFPLTTRGVYLAISLVETGFI